MLKHFLITALRNYYKRKIYSFISLSGLILAFTVSFLILIYAINELSVNREFINFDRIYRVVNNVKSTSSTWAVTVKDLGPQIESTIDGLVGVSRMTSSSRAAKIKINQKMVDTKSMFVDNDFFYMFENESGINQELEFKNPYSVVITKQLADKISTDTSIEGETIELEVLRKEVLVTVVKVIDGFTKKSNLKADVFMSMDLFDKLNDAAILDVHPFFHTFIMVAPQSNLESIQAGLDAMDKDHFDGTKISNFELQPFSDFYLNSAGLANHHYITGDKSKIQLFITVASLLLLIAIVNYTILATANALYRLKEFGIRKTFGSDSIKLRIQTLSESMSMAFIALPISIILTELLLPTANNFWGKDLDFHILKNWPIVLIFFLLCIVTGLISGSYLSFYISKLNPTLILATSGNRNAGSSVRKYLIVIQIFIFVLLTSFSILILKQMDYFQSKPLGYNPDNLLVYYLEIKQTEENNKTNATHIESFVKELNSFSHIDVASYFEGRVPPFQDNTGSQGVTTSMAPDDLKFFLTLNGDHNTVTLMGLNILKGSNFRKGIYKKVLLTETGAKHLELKDPIGETIIAGLGGSEVIGIVEDFHAQSFRRDIAPMLIRYNQFDKKIGQFSFYRLNFGIRYKSGKEQETIDLLNSKLKEYFPAYEVEWAFQKDRIKGIYTNEQKVAQTVMLGVIIVVFISSLGLFALSLYESERRMKEIAIRKINGASTHHIVMLLSSDFTKWVILAFILACPVSYYFMERWLENYIYQTLISWWIFPLTGLITLIITWITISFQSIRAALLNPVRTLRND